MMKKELNERILDGYVTIPEAVKETGCNYMKIYGIYQRKRIRIIEGNPPLIHLIDLKVYLTAHPIIEKDLVWDNINPTEKEMFYPATGYDFRYFATSKGRFVNLTTGEELITCPRESDGYIQLTLIKDGQQVYEYLHRLVLASCCPPNDCDKYATTAEILEKTKYIGHHIIIGREGKKDNKPESLAWTNPDILFFKDGQELNEHQKLHQLWNDGKKKEYWQMVKRVKRDNERKLYKIEHPEFKNDSRFHYFLWVDEKGKKAFDKGKSIPNASIYRETAEYQMNDN